MRIPIWLTLGFGALVILFGAYRIWLGVRKADEGEAPRQTGLYKMSKRTHLLVGLVYLLLGVGLVATTFGFRPF